jgi:ubiquinone/menaquinone biosynthesis C-methylase UbiE
MEWFILILVALGLWLVVHMHDYGYVYEGFEDGGEAGSTSKKEAGAPTEERHDYDSIYDDFYASVYSKLFETPGLISFQKASIRENALAEWPKKDIKLLDVCCGVAPLAEWLCKEGVDVVGVDQSEAMLKKARETCKSARFYKADVTRVETFTPKSFSHALMLYFSIYQFQNPKMVLDNIYSWLKPGGIFVIHLVDPAKFDPILPAASPFLAFSVQKYSTERVIDSDIFFDAFKYKSRFLKDPDEDKARFEEVFELKNPHKYIENVHELHMPSVPDMLDILRSSGFSKHEIVDMTSVGYEYQYLVFLSK